MLVSFVRPGGGEAAVGLLAADGGRVVDLTAIGLEDVYAALPRAKELERLARHLSRAGAVAYDVGSVRLLAPVPYARLVRADVGAPVGAAETTLPPLLFADPREIAGPGSHLTAAEDALMGVGVAGVVAGGGRDLDERTAAAQIAGVTLFVEWHDPTAPIAARDGAGLASGPAIGPLPGDDDELVVAAPGESARRISLGGAAGALARSIAAASRRYTLRAGDIFLHEAGAVDVPLAPGDSAEVVVEASWGALAHVARRAG